MQVATGHKSIVRSSCSKDCTHQLKAAGMCVGVLISYIRIFSSTQLLNTCAVEPITLKASPTCAVEAAICVSAAGIGMA